LIIIKAKKCSSMFIHGGFSVGYTDSIVSEKLKLARTTAASPFKECLLYSLGFKMAYMVSSTRAN